MLDAQFRGETEGKECPLPNMSAKLSVPERSEGTEVAKIDVRGGFGGVSPPFEGRHPPRRGCARGGRARQVVQPRRSSSSLSVCLLLGELVRDGLTDRDETFGGDIWHCQERISLKPARLVYIWGV